MRHRGLSGFTVSARNLDDPSPEPVIFVFARSGLTWRMVAIKPRQFGRPLPATGLR